MIDIAALVDKYIDEEDGAYGFGAERSYPRLYSFNIDGAKWLTDRYWFLPESMCDLSRGKFDVTEVKAGRSLDSARKHVEIIQAAPLLPAKDRFAATFAGVLTLHGLTAHAAEGADRTHVLVDGNGARVGCIQPLTDPTPYSASIPISDECRDMHRRISLAEMVRPWQAWDLAAFLTSDALVGEPA